MLKEREKLIRRATMLLDASVVALAFFAAYYLRVHFHVFYRFDLVPSARVIGAPAQLQDYLPTLFLWMPLWVLMLALNGAYRPFRTRAFLEIVWIMLRSGCLTALAFGSLAFILKLQFVSRVFFVMFVGLSSGFLVLEKWALFSAAHYVRRIGYNFRRLLIVGTGPRAERFAQMVKAHPEWGLQINGLIDDEAEKVGREFFGLKVLGLLADIPRILQEEVIDEVIFVVPRMWLERIQTSIAACELQGVKTSVAADLFDLKIAMARQTDLDGFPLLSFETTFGREWQLFVKRAIDLTVSVLGLIAFAPVLLLIAGLIKVSSPGPLLFRQKRLGLSGRIFTLYKFRTMFKDAEKELEKVEDLNEMDGPAFKIRNDPRVTPVGYILRRLSADELPQLFNVLMGQMSLVGPRPPLPEEVEKYALWQRRRLSMRPGLTCVWQTSGRNNIGFAEWMELDLRYIDNWSLWLDFKILMKTVPTVLLGVGAS